MQIEEREFSGLEDTDEGQRLKSLYRKISADKSNFEKQQREFRKTQADAMQGLKTMDAIRIGKELGFDELGLGFDTLLDCSTRHEMAIKAAKMVAEKLKTPSSQPPKQEPPKESALPEHIDSAVQNAGGPSMMFKASDIEKMTPDERARNRSEIAKAVKEGRIDYSK